MPDLGGPHVKTKEELRNDFVIKMYETFWNNISRAEDTAWKMMASYTALFAGVSLAVPYITIVGFVSIVAIFSFLAAAISLNANLWFVRNISMISSIEKELLLDTDYGKILPKSFQNKLPFFSWAEIEVWWLLIPVFIAVPLATFGIAFNSLAAYDRLVIAKLFAILSFVTVGYGWSLRKRHLKYLDETKSTPPAEAMGKAA